MPASNAERQRRSRERQRIKASLFDALVNVPSSAPGRESGEQMMGQLANIRRHLAYVCDQLARFNVECEQDNGL